MLLNLDAYCLSGDPDNVKTGVGVCESFQVILMLQAHKKWFLKLHPSCLYLPASSCDSTSLQNSTGVQQAPRVILTMALESLPWIPDLNTVNGK